MLDLSRMRGVFVDPKAKTARVQAGCLLGDVDRETQLHGLATVLGFVSETGVSGLTLGGGFGYRAGFTAGGPGFRFGGFTSGSPPNCEMMRAMSWRIDAASFTVTS